MNETATDPQQLSTVQLIDRLSAQVSLLVRTEIAHAVGEVKTKGTRIGVGVGISGAGTLLLLYGLAALFTAAILGLATAVEPWLAAAIVAVVLLLLGGILAATGASRAKKAAPPVPADTAASVRTDVNVVKESL